MEIDAMTIIEIMKQKHAQRVSDLEWENTQLTAQVMQLRQELQEYQLMTTPEEPEEAPTKSASRGK